MGFEEIGVDGRVQLTTHMVWYVLFLIFATYVMLPMPLLWSVLASGVSVIIHLITFIVSVTIHPSSPWEVRYVFYKQVMLSVNQIFLHVWYCVMFNNRMGIASLWVAVLIWFFTSPWISLVFTQNIWRIEPEGKRLRKLGDLTKCGWKRRRRMINKKSCCYQVCVCFFKVNKKINSKNLICT